MKGAYTITDSSGSRSGTITLVATASGQGQSTLILPSGTYTEFRSISTGSASLIEIGPDGVPHSIATQAAVSPNPAWFCPALVLTSASYPNYASSYVGQETLDGTSVQHLAVWWLPGNNSGDGTASASGTQFWQSLTQHDIYVDATSLLPVAMTFHTQPYDPTAPNTPIVPYRGNNAGRTMQLLFSNYQVVEGRPVALHLHGTLPISGNLTITTDIQLSSVAFNTGATVTAPSAVN